MRREDVSSIPQGLWRQDEVSKLLMLCIIVDVMECVQETKRRQVGGVNGLPRDNVSE